MRPMTYAHAHGPATRTPDQEAAQSACVPVERQPEPSSSQGEGGFLLREHITRRERRLFIAEFVASFARVSK